MKKNMYKCLGRKKTVVLGITLIFILSVFTSVAGSQNIKIRSNQSTDAIDSDTIQYESNPGPLPLGAGVPWGNTNWQYRKEITINHSKVSASLTNFPVLVSLNSDADLANNAQDDGDDIVFTDDKDNQLHHEIEYFDGSTGELVCWVNVTSLSSTEDTIIYLYYGNLICSNQQDVTGVWDPNFVMVQHLSETSGTHYDSTSYGNDGSPQGILSQSAVGKIDGADGFDGCDDYIEVANSDSLQLINAISIEVWAKADIFSSWRTIAAKDDIGTLPEWWFGYNYLNKLDFKFNAQDGMCINSNTVITDSDWHHLVGVYNGSHIYVFVDGALDCTPLSYSNILNNIGTLNIGYTKFWNCCRFNGLIDEVRVLNVARDASWIATEYNNQNDPSSFYSVGSEEIVNMKPTANFTYIPENPSTQDVIQFNDTSTDSDGTIVSWSWDFGDGNVSSVQNSTHQYADDGIYTVTLTVTDDGGRTDDYEDDIPIGNAPPNAYIDSITPNPALLGEIVSFVGYGTDNDGTIIDWEWNSSIDGFLSNQPSFQIYNCLSLGDHTITFRVKDDDNEWSNNETQILIINAPPVANFTFEPSDPSTQNVIYFNSTSYDSDGSIVNWTWDLGDTTFAYTENLTHQYSKNGTFSVVLLVRDNLGAEDTFSDDVVVSNIPPNALFTYSPSSPSTLDIIQFTDTSTDSDGTIVSWLWDFDDGNASPEQNPTHQYAEEGNYEVSLTVTDNDGGSDTVTKDIEVVYEDDTTPPTVKITKPEKGLYIFNFKIRPFLIRKPLIIGKIDIEVDATDDKSGIERVEFFIDGESKANIVTLPYTYTWKRDKIRIFGHRHTVKVVAFDNAGNNASEEIEVWKFL